MKRTLGSLAFGMVAAASMAQANFTIVRPADGAHVREKVHILFPKGSIPSGGYVGIFLNGQLIDAKVPEADGKNLEYVLDTKGRGLKDTDAGKPDKLEAKLYVDYNDQPRIVKTSSVDLYIGNMANINVPADGVKLRYAFKAGEQMIYDLDQKVAEDTISQSENEKGGKPAELPLDSEHIRLLYAVDNSYPGGDGLLRMQALPEKGKSYAILTTLQSTEPKTYYDYMMASIYMKVNNTGHELFGSIPLYYPLEGSAGQGNNLDLWADFPLPTLPVKPVKPGDSWQSRFQGAHLDLSDLFNQTTLVRNFPARGQFVDVEWERGHPCAKIENSIEASELSDEDKKLLNKGANIAGDKVKVEETIWFALDLHKILEIERDATVETKSQTGAGAGSFGPGGPGGSMPGMGGGAPAGVGGGNRGKEDFTIPLNQFGRGGGGKFGGGQRPGMPGNFGGPGRPGGAPPGIPGGGGGMFGTSNGTPSNQAEYVRLRIQQIFTLEL